MNCTLASNKKMRVHLCFVSALSAGWLVRLWDGGLWVGDGLEATISGDSSWRFWLVLKQTWIAIRGWQKQLSYIQKQPLLYNCFFYTIFKFYYVQGVIFLLIYCAYETHSLVVYYLMCCFIALIYIQYIKTEFILCIAWLQGYFPPCYVQLTEQNWIGFSRHELMGFGKIFLLKKIPQAQIFFTFQTL